MEPQSMLLIFNPVAGAGAFADHLFQVVDRFTRSGFEVTVFPTAGPRDAYRVALERGASFSHLVCSGGDGTLREVVDALMLLDQKPLLGYIPSGTTNDFAYSHGLSTDVLVGVEEQLGGSPASIDIGGFQDGFFTYVAAFGLFTDVSYGTPQGMKNMLGHAAYILEGIKKLGSIRSVHCRVECDGEVIEDDFVLGMVSNSRSVAGFHLPAGMDIQLDDGLFELILLRKIEGIAELHNVVATLAGRRRPGNSFVVRSIREATITCQEPLDWSVDGEFGGGHTTTHIRVHQQAIQMVSGPETLPR